MIKKTLKNQTKQMFVKLKKMQYNYSNTHDTVKIRQ